MATALKTEASDYQVLYSNLSKYLESDAHPEHLEILEIVSRVETIKQAIIGLSKEGAISAEGSFPPDKIQEAQQLLHELQQQLEKVFKIHQKVAMRWMAQKIDEGSTEEILTPVVTAVLNEYLSRWSNMNS